MFSTSRPEKKLTLLLPKRSGRDNTGQISIRHQGGRQKQFYRLIDFKRAKHISARVDTIEYDPSRRARIALVTYKDGEKAYIIAPEGLEIGNTIITGADAEIKVGNTLKLKSIPVGTLIHNVELVPGRGAKLVRAAGTAAVVLAREEKFVQVKFPSGEIRRVPEECIATVGQVSNGEWRHEIIGKAGRARLMGRRPTVRGVAQNPRTHPHGGGEGRSGIGMVSPKSPWGKRTLGKRTRNRKKYSNKFIVSRRKK